MVRKLVEQDQVLLLFQTLGTPSNSAIRKYMNDEQVPQLFVATGATKWGDPKGHPWTMGWQPTYQAEGHIYAQYVLKNVPDGKVGILYQNDDYGKDYLKGFKDGLGDVAKKVIVLEQSYEVTDPTVDSQIVNLKNSGANVFFNVTTPKFAAQAIKKAADIGWKPIHLLNNVSASVGAVLKPAGLDASKGLITVQYLKDPTDPQWKNDQGYKDWLVFMDKYYPDGNKTDAFNVYGYSVAQTMVQVLKQAGNDLSRANVMKQAASLKDFVSRCCCPASRSTRARRTSTRSSRSSSPASTASAGCSSARSSTRRRSSHDRLVGTGRSRPGPDGGIALERGRERPVAALGEEVTDLLATRDPPPAAEGAALHGRHRVRERERPFERPVPQLADHARAMEDIAGAVGVDHGHREPGRAHETPALEARAHPPLRAWPPPAPVRGPRAPASPPRAGRARSPGR